MTTDERSESGRTHETSSGRIASVFAGLIAVAASCAGGNAMPIDPLAAPADRAGCELAERRCSRCHPFDRVLTTTISEPAGWRTQVRRMRLVPGSGIARTEERPIVECLVARSFGASGIARLEGSW